MKKIFSKKRLAVVFIITVIVLIPVVIFAIDPEYPFYRSYALTDNGKKEVISKIGSSTIVNRSDKDYFVPNNTAPEYDAWSKKAPNYVGVSVCGKFKWG